MNANSIRYLNTDLDLVSSVDLRPLAAHFEAAGVSFLYVTHGEDGLWYTTLETDDVHTEPETNIAAMLAVVESLPGSLRQIWDDCTRRDFNIGYDSGISPRSFEQGLSTGLLSRMVAVGACLRLTLFPYVE